MTADRGEHIDADGRWWAVPVRERLGLKPKQQVAFVLIVFAAVALLLVALGTPGPASAIAGLLLSFVLAVCLIVLPGVLVYIAVSKRIGRSDQAAHVVPVCSTELAARLALMERVPSRRRMERWRREMHRLHRGESDTPSDELRAEFADIKSGSGAVSEFGLLRARACAAALRLSGARSDGFEEIGYARLANPSLVGGIAIPPLLAIDDVDFDAPPRRWSSRGAFKVVDCYDSVEARLDHVLRWVERAGFVGMLAVGGGLTTLPKSSPAWYVLLISMCIPAGVACAATGWRLARRRWIARVEIGSLVVRRSKGDSAQGFVLSPDKSIVIIYPRLARAITGLGEPHRDVRWRFLIEDDPHFIEIKNFDPRGTEWERLVESLQALEAAALAARACSPVGPGGILSPPDSEGVEGDIPGL